VGHGNGQHAVPDNYDLRLRTLGVCVEGARSNCIINTLSTTS
jgi:hypothetical protein